jgi:hypothetical protein
VGSIKFNAGGRAAAIFYENHENQASASTLKDRGQQDQKAERSSKEFA